MGYTADQKLGESYAAELAAVKDSTPQLRQSILLDLLGADRSLWPALRHLIEQPGFEALRREPSHATRLAGSEAWLQELATWCNHDSLVRVSAFLDGLLQLGGHNSQLPLGSGHPAHERSDASKQPSRAKTTGQQDEQPLEATRLSQQGIEASDHGEHQRALELFTEALRKDPGEPKLYMQRACVLAILGQAEASILDFDAVLRLQPGNLEALAERGKAKADLGMIADAKQDWLKACRGGHQQASEWLRQQWQSERAESDMGMILKEDYCKVQPSETWQSVDEVDDGEGILAACPELPRENSNRPNSSSVLCGENAPRSSTPVSTAKAATASTQTSLACQKPNMHANISLSLSSVASVLITLLVCIGIALLAYRRGFWHNPSSSYLAQGRAGAVKPSQEGQQTDPFLAEASAVLGRGGREKQVISLADRSLQRARSADAYYLRGVAKGRLGDRQGAIIDFNSSLAVDAGYVAALIGRGYVKYEIGDTQGSIDDLDRVLSLDASNVVAYNNRAFARKQLGDLRGACEDWAHSAGLGDGDAARQLRSQCP